MSGMDPESSFDALFNQAGAPAARAGAAPWKVLLVDDAPDMHAVLALSLGELEVEGAELLLLHAQSAREARLRLAEHPDLALILLDVVMESRQAGLELVRFVREELGNRTVQIVLVTGQPGEAPQRRVVTDYDINGYLLKSELTSDRVFVAVHTALRTCRAFRALEARQEQLRLAQGRLAGERTLRSAIVESSDDAIIGKTLEGVVTSWNRGAERMFGYAEADMVGQPITRIIPADRLEEEERVLAEIRHGRSIQHFETERRHRDGSLIPISLTVSPIVDGGGAIIGASKIARDITTRRAAEEARRALQAQVVQSQRLESLGNLAAGVAHNLNNVLAVVMGTASLRETLAGDPADREAYGIIGKASRRGRDVLKAMLQFGHPSPPARAPLELLGLLGELRPVLAASAGAQVRILEEAAAEPLWLNGDASTLSQVVMNLCLNALDAMPEGGLVLLRTSRSTRDWVELSVVDAGAGMAPEVLAHALEPFFTTKEVGKGTGLGLSVAYGAVTAHGGTLGIESEVGKGTAVTLRLPRIPAPGLPRPLAAPGLGALDVYLVDDDEDVRFLVQRMLKKAGVRSVRTFAGGREVLAGLAAGELPDLVILDQNMPGMNGIQTMEAIRERHPGLPILISSGQPDLETWEPFHRAGVGVIPKPFTVEEIQARLARFAAGGGSRQN